MVRNDSRSLAAIFLILAAMGLYFGWREFRFLTDDAYIAFRYISNDILGNGFVWNAAPFRAVEGYTSFLWVLILDIVWRFTGVEPPDSANILSLVFSFGTMVLLSFAILRMNLNKELARKRSILLGLALTGLLVDTTFLTWSSSGLETALFNFLFTFWIIAVVFGNHHSPLWRFTVTLTASLVYLARPDGIVVVVTTMALMVPTLIGSISRKEFNVKWVLTISPLIIPPMHEIWRLYYYGAWLPNTYYAKYVTAWPEAGIRYLISFCLEYGVWIWLILLAITVITAWNRSRRKGEGITAIIKGYFPDARELPGDWLCFFIAVITLCAQLGNYTFSIGGDHFEWRVFSHLPPLLLLSLIYLLNKMRLRPKYAIAVMVIYIAFSIPIPWTIHLEAKKVSSMTVSSTLHISTADKLPIFLWPIAKADDILQRWLSAHLVCIRRQEHKLFLEYQLKKYPRRIMTVPKYAGKYPVGYFTTVGVPGWAYPTVAIIDGYGLNDYIIARNPIPPNKERRMAHERSAPDSYIASFVPNLLPDRDGVYRFYDRPEELELTSARIKLIENYWENKIVHGINIPDSAIPFPIPDYTS